MKTNKKMFIYMIIVMSVVFISTYLGYLYFNYDDTSLPEKDMMAVPKEENLAKLETPLERINENTDIQLNYKEDGVVTDTITKKASTSLINMTERDLENALEDVNILKFSDNLVVIEKDETSYKNSYIVGNNEGYVSIFFRDSDNTIKLLNQTSILIEPLPEQDKIMLNEGIVAENNSELNKIIEDYTS